MVNGTDRVDESGRPISFELNPPAPPTSPVFPDSANSAEDPEDLARDMPAWTKEAIGRFAAGISHTFMLYLNIADYVFYRGGAITLNDFIVQKMLDDNFLLIAYYDRATGLSFRTDEMRRLFEEIFLPKVENEKPVENVATRASKEEDKADQKGIPRLPADPGTIFPLLGRMLRTRLADQIVVEGFAKFAELNPEAAGHELQRKTGVLALIVNFPETLIPDGEMSRLSVEDRNNSVAVTNWSRSEEISKSGNLIFLLTEGVASSHKMLHSPLSRVEAIKIPLPDYNERLEFVNYILGQGSDVLAPHLTREHFASLTSGLSRIDIEDIIKRAGYSDSKIDESFVWDQKKQILQNEAGDIIDIVEPRWGFDVIGGLERNKAYLLRTRDSIIGGERLKVPVGILLLGPPGTGKTVTAEAFAKELGFSMVKPKRIREMWVGSTERNWDRFEEMVRAMAPVVVFTDEFDDETEGRHTGPSLDAGTSERLRGRQMVFMSDTTLRGKVIWMAASNRPDRIDPAILRSGRFDTKLFFPPPTEVELASIFEAIFKKMVDLAGDYNRSISIAVTEEQIKELARKAKERNLTGADVELVCHRAYDKGDDSILDFESLVWALDDLLDDKDKKSYDFMIDLALKQMTSRDLLPEEWLERYKKLKRGRQEPLPAWYSP